MAWIYLAELGESQSQSTNTSEQSLTVKTIDTLNLSYFQECLKEKFTGDQSGITSKPLQQNNYHQLTLSSADSPAKISVQQELELAWKESEAVFSSKLSDLQKKFDQLLSSLKMSPRLELEDWIRLSKHLPKSGMIVDGRVYLPAALEHHTGVNDGFSWPTPQARDFRSGDNPNSIRAIRKKKQGWSRNLNDAVKMDQPETIGQLNPVWVEWLMGYETAWTELNVLGIQWFRVKSKKHLKS